MKTKYLFLSVLMLLGMLLPIASTAFSRDTSTNQSPTGAISPDIGKLADHVRETTAGFHAFGSIAYASYGKFLDSFNSMGQQSVSGNLVERSRHRATPPPPTPAPCSKLCKWATHGVHFPTVIVTD